MATGRKKNEVDVRVFLKLAVVVVEEEKIF